MAPWRCRCEERPCRDGPVLRDAAPPPRRRDDLVVGAEDILELTDIACTYEMYATTCRALRLAYDDVADASSKGHRPGVRTLDPMRGVER